MFVAFLLQRYFFRILFQEWIQLGYVCCFFTYLAGFFKCIEIFSSHYSTVSSVPFLQIIRLKACAQETPVLYPWKNVHPPSNLQRASPTRQVTMPKKRKLSSKGHPAQEEKKRDADRKQLHMQYWMASMYTQWCIVGPIQVCRYSTAWYALILSIGLQYGLFY
jgi:hypothetical protein